MVFNVGLPNRFDSSPNVASSKNNRVAAIHLFGAARRFFVIQSPPFTGKNHFRAVRVFRGQLFCKAKRRWKEKMNHGRHGKEKEGAMKIKISSTLHRTQCLLATGAAVAAQRFFENPTRGENAEQRGE